MASTQKSPNLIQANRYFSRSPQVSSPVPSEAIFRSLDVAVIGLNPNGMVEHANSVAEEWFASTHRTLRGQLISEILHNLDMPFLRRRLLDDQRRDVSASELPPCDLSLEDVSLTSSRSDYIMVKTNHVQKRYVKLSILPHHLGGAGLTLILQDVATINGAFKEMLWEANHDFLTGLLNRRAFESELELAWNGLKEGNQSHMLFFLDLDRFKLVNDTCGHAAGDQVLQIIASLFQVQLDESAYLARIGGDEFGVLLPNASLSEGMRVAECLRKSVEEYRFYFENETFQLGVSIGITPVTNDTESLDEVLSMADSACYKAKHSGRNHIHVYQENSPEVSVQRQDQKCLRLIQNSLENDRFQLFYQSIIPCGASPDVEAVVYAEVLLRMIGGNDDLISPELFIPTAERNEYMHEIDLWVVKSICDLLTQPSLETLPTIDRWFVNLSATSIGYEPLLQYLFRQFRKFPMLAQYLCFEITETAVIKDLPKAINFIRVLKSFGCQFALDDFVGGISPFNYIQLLPVDYVKIDGSLIGRMSSDPLSSSIVEFVAKIAHLMEMEVIAEGIETSEIQAQVQHQFDSDYMQGYSIMMPERLSFLGDVA